MKNQVTVRAVSTPAGTSGGQAGIKKVHLVNADGTEAGTIKPQSALANSTATDVTGIVASHNALLAKLRSAGVILP